ncbi:putative F-box protein At3g16210 [Rutidosis leptorrhynchoides]|uniref:putative F-box protein At3g16210 n=1 Tax=Rutidosis leptorrhynchoides TaxID=125765 RepID=UPI003A99B429
MSDNIPFEIQTEIVKKLPVKSLLRFRQVSKSWKSLIDGSEFVANYHLSNKQQRLLVRHVDSPHKVVITPGYREFESKLEDEKYVSIVDDDEDSFPQNKSPLMVPSNVKQLKKFPDIIGSSMGLLCLCRSFKEFYYWHGLDKKTRKKFVLWNLTIRKSITIVVPNVPNTNYFQTVVGFGVCPRTSDPKLVKITYILSLDYMKEHIPWQVELFSLSSGSWKSLSMSVPRKSVLLRWKQVCIDKFIYWLVADRIHDVGEEIKKNLILSFDMTTEEFIEIDLPNNLAYSDNNFLHVSKLLTSLVVVEADDWPVHRKYSVWMMKHEVPNSFTKLFVINSPSESLGILKVHGFRKTGEPIIEMNWDNTDFYNTDAHNAVFVYEPESGEISDIGIARCGFACFAISYVETLLLLNK